MVWDMCSGVMINQHELVVLTFGYLEMLPCAPLV